MSSQDNPIRVLVIGAHPDDCDVAAGGLAAVYTSEGHTVKFFSMTNGDTGHHRIGGGDLARRRYAETQASARVLGIEYEVNDHHCGHLEPSLVNRQRVIRTIRNFKADLVLTHTPDDYHPDHRYTSFLVQDAAYLVTVPGMCPLTPHLRKNPVFGYVAGTETVSAMFRPDVLVDLGQVIEKKLAMLFCHESQWLEWIPYNRNCEDEVPSDPDGQREYMRNRWDTRLKPFAEKWRDRLIEQYGRKRGEKVQFAEGIQICPFGAQPDQAERRRLFPFLPPT